MKRKDSSKHLNIHLVPHTHLDAGWTWTYEEFFSGLKGNDKTKVSQIISGVIIELLKDPEMRFNFVEMKFFNMWYTR